jgi:hypothetical protein
MEPVKLKSKLTKTELLKQISAHFNHIFKDYYPFFKKGWANCTDAILESLEKICSGEITYTDEKIKDYEDFIRKAYK